MKHYSIVKALNGKGRMPNKEYTVMKNNYPVSTYSLTISEDLVGTWCVDQAGIAHNLWVSSPYSIYGSNPKTIKDFLHLLGLGMTDEDMDRVQA